MNLELSQERALSVATYCLQMPQLTKDQLTLLPKHPHRQGPQLFRPHLRRGRQDRHGRFPPGGI